MVGDPSGKRTERPMLIAGADRRATLPGDPRPAARDFLSFEGANAARLRNNADWLRPLRLMEFLRDTGKHFTVNYMLQKESVQSRMESGHLLHRVQLHAGPGVRLLAPVPDRGLRAADGRQRPVGQHHGRHRADRQAGAGRRSTDWSSRCSAPRPADEVRQERGRQRLARLRSGPARTSSISSGSTPTTGTSSDSSSSSPSFH